MISGVIITLNEQNHISECINSLRPLVRDIIVVDSGSTDATIELAKEAGATVINHAWTGYGAAKNTGAVQVKNDWILSIDADERCTPEMCTRIADVSLEKENVYAFKRKNMYRGRLMKHGMLQPEWKTRLYHRTQASWDDRKVHEQLIYDTSVREVKLSGDLIHDAYQDEEEMMSRLDQYARLTAEAWQSVGYKPPVIAQRLGPYFHFFRAYFLKLGFLEGARGLETSIAAFSYSRKKYVSFHATD